MKKIILFLSFIICISTGYMAAQLPARDKETSQSIPEEIYEFIGSETKAEFNSSAVSLTAPNPAQDQPELKSFFERVSNAHFTQYHINRLIQVFHFLAPFFIMLNNENLPLWLKLPVAWIPLVRVIIALRENSQKAIDEYYKSLLFHFAGLAAGLILERYPLEIRPVIPMNGAAARQPGRIAELAQDFLGNIIGQANAA